MKKKILTFVSLLIFIIGFAFYYFLFFKKSEDLSSNLNQENKIPVKVISIKKSPYQEVLSAQGSLIYSKSVNLISQRSGVIAGIFFKNGEYVKKGQLLISIDDEPLKYKVKSEYAVYLKKKDLYDRNNLLAQSDNGFVSQSQLKISKQEYLEAYANYNSARVELEQTKIVAPFDGFMGALGSSLNIGSKVNTNDILVKIVNTNNIEVQYFLNQKFLREIKHGQSVDVYLNNNKKIMAKVIYIDPEVSSYTNSFEVRALIDQGSNNINDIKPTGGMMVLVKQKLPEVENVILVPGLSLIPDSDGYSVFIINPKDNKAEKEKVSVSGSVDNMFFITSGLKVGQQLVVVGQESLGNGSLVKII